MNPEEIKKKVKAVLSYNLDMPVRKIKLGSSLSDDLGIDSYGMIEVGYALEEAFDISIMKNPENLPKIRTVKDVVYLIKLKIGGNKPK